MIRYTLLWMVVTFIVIYAWKDWCKALCMLLVMLAVLERPDMPKGMLGIPGMNPFNFALFSILAAWAVEVLKRRERWDMPNHVTLLLVAYFVIMWVAFGRMITDHLPLTNPDLPPELRRTPRELWIDFLVNTTKWTIPGLLLLHGARDRGRMRMAVLCMLALLLLLSLQVIRNMPVTYLADGEALQQRALRVLDKRVGYHRVDLAMVLAGAPWAFMAARGIVTSAAVRSGMVVMSGICFLGLALTGGRTGYMSWAAAGALMCAVRWRSYLLLAPVGAILVAALLPGAVDRMLQGVDIEALSGSHAGSPVGGLLDDEAVDTNRLTSGRVEVWPYVIRKIKERPFTGFGRRGHERAGVWTVVWLEMNEIFGHPHNAFLEFTLDNGVIALAFVLTFYAIVSYKALRLFMDRQDDLATAIGGFTLAMVLTFLMACIGAQSLYPIQSAVMMWCGMGLTLRLWQQRRAAPAAAAQPTVETGVAVAPSAVAVRPGAVALWPKAPRRL